MDGREYPQAILKLFLLQPKWRPMRIIYLYYKQPFFLWKAPLVPPTGTSNAYLLRKAPLWLPAVKQAYKKFIRLGRHLGSAIRQLKKNCLGFSLTSVVNCHSERKVCSCLRDRDGQLNTVLASVVCTSESIAQAIDMATVSSSGNFK